MGSRGRDCQRRPSRRNNGADSTDHLLEAFEAPATTGAGPTSPCAFDPSVPPDHATAAQGWPQKDGVHRPPPTAACLSPTYRPRPWPPLINGGGTTAATNGPHRRKPSPRIPPGST